MTVESDYEAAARDLLAHHLASLGLRATMDKSGVATGLGRISIDFNVDSVSPSDSEVRMVFWARIGGVSGVTATIALDMLGSGSDAHEALLEGVHGVLDGVIPVLRQDREPSTASDGVIHARVTSTTDGIATAWDLLMGPPTVGGDTSGEIKKTIDSGALFQGVLDSLTPALESIGPHWYKLALVRARDGQLIGDMKIDGVAVGLAASFESDAWPDSMFVRQFGIVRPADRQPNLALLESAGIEGSKASRRSRLPWRGRS